MDQARLQAAFSNLVYQLPVMVICLGCAIIVCAKWRQAAAGAVWALLGFGMVLLLSFAFPFAQSVAVRWAVDNGTPVDHATTVVALVFSLLRGISYILLLVGVLAGRTAAPAGYPPQNYPPQNYTPQNYPSQNYQPPQPGQYR